MKTGNLLMAAAVLTVIMAFSAESFARGAGGGAGRGAGQGAQRSQQSATSATQVRPTGSQRRDGTFLQTGTTASGATTRPSNGRGVMNGTGPNAVAPTTATVQ